MMSPGDFHNVLRRQPRVQNPAVPMSDDQMELQRTPAREPGMPPTREPSAGLAEQARVTLLYAVQTSARAVHDDLELRALMRELCAAAQSSGLRAEQLLILLKEAWRELPPSRRPPFEEERATFSRLVTLCIQAYYS